MALVGRRNRRAQLEFAPAACVAQRGGASTAVTFFLAVRGGWLRFRGLRPLPTRPLGTAGN